MALVGAVLVSLLLAAGGSTQRLAYFIPASRLAFPEWLRGPLSELELSLTPAVAATLLVVLCGCYAVALTRAREIGLRSAVLAIVAAHAAFTLAAPLYSADVFSYLDYARLGVLHGMSPYLHGAVAAPHDAVMPYVRWRDVATPYGPLFTIATYPLAWLGVPAAFWTLKLLAGAASLGCIALVARIARQVRRPVVPAVLFVGLNPIVLAYGVGGGHNDFFAVLLMLGGVSLALDRRDDGASAGFVLAAAVKAPAGLALAFLLIARRSRRGIAIAVLTALAVAGIGALAFGASELTIVDQLAGQQKMVAILSVPNTLGALLGLGGITGGLRILDAIALCGGMGLLAWRTWHGADWLASTGWATLLVLLTSAWLLPWYLVWLLPITALAGDERLRTATLMLTAFVVTTHVAHYIS
ncbi:MAG TPA: glycosyltransferase family 87 protein [Solirubrobacteraceae bacterium]|jgi:alpha-1,6-mannosyltransferase